MSTFSEVITFEILTCGLCGIAFGIPTVFDRKRHEDHETWYCPNGHPRHFPAESEVEKLKRQLQYQQDYSARLNSQLTDERNSHRTTKGHVTRLRNRTIAGACPFCGEHVYQLARHVARKHPDEQPEAE